MEAVKNNPAVGQRRVKIQSKHVLRAYNQQTSFPEIRLSGKWLQDAGFNSGQSVTILHEKNRIVITTDPV